jgi:Ca2+-binding EF-hand superfamily protein
MCNEGNASHAGYRKGPKGTCKICKKEGLNPLFLVPVVLVLMYSAFRHILANRHKHRFDTLHQARELFYDLDLDGSGEISRHEMQQSLKVLGHKVDKLTAIRIFDLIDLDRSGGINVHEFEAWMDHHISQTKIYRIVAKILFGLFQVLSRQPDTVKEEYPGEQWDNFKLFSFDFSWSMPVCSVNYYLRWLFNAFLLPLGLLALVEFTWKTQDVNWKAVATCGKEKRRNRGVTHMQSPGLAHGLEDGHLTEDTLREIFRASLAAETNTPIHSLPKDITNEKISRVEIGNVLARVGNKLTEEQLADVMHQMDQDHDGRASLRELEEWLEIEDSSDGNQSRDDDNLMMDRYFAFFLCCQLPTKSISLLQCYYSACSFPFGVALLTKCVPVALLLRQTQP